MCRHANIYGDLDLLPCLMLAEHNTEHMKEADKYTHPKYVQVTGRRTNVFPHAHRHRRSAPNAGICCYVFFFLPVLLHITFDEDEAHLMLCCLLLKNFACCLVLKLDVFINTAGARWILGRLVAPPFRYYYHYDRFSVFGKLFIIIRRGVWREPPYPITWMARHEFDEPRQA